MSSIHAESDYVELHAHSAYSFLDGASQPQELVERAVELGYSALALTDHDGLYGSMEFAQAARARGLQSITGAELTLEGGSHVTVLAETPVGYANLSCLITQARMESPRGEPELPLESLLERTEGIILLTGCRKGPIDAALARGAGHAERLACRLREAFGPANLFVELQHNFVRGDVARSKAAGALADRLRIPVVATGNVHYHVADRHWLQDVFVSIRNRMTLDDSHAQRRPNACFYLASPGEMAARFAFRPDAIRNTRLIAERCKAFNLTADLGYRFPDFRGGGTSAREKLGAVCHAAMEVRYPPGSPHRTEAEQRLATELALVERHGLSGFFLVYHDILELARKVAGRVRGDSMPRQLLPPGRGRGSSVSSIICYLIGLSHVDPIQTNLFLGRFLNDAMESVPDIDIDFARDIREELILAVYEHYGYDHVGLVCAFPTYRTRSIARELGKTLGLPPGDIEKVAKLAEPGADGFTAELERIPGLEARSNSRLWRLFSQLAEQMRGLPRHISQHVGGMVISSRPLAEIVPLEPAAWEGRVLCQWDKDSCDDARFIKIDFLALGMMSLVEDTVEMIADRHGSIPDLSRINHEDEKIYDRICSGDTVGLFQVESRAQIQMARRVRPRNLADLAVQVAIVRPGPIVGGAVNPYVRRRERLRDNPGYKVPYDHPLLEEALGETLGVIIFQDQVLQVCQALAGFTDGQAEDLRRAMSRKRSRQALLEYWEAFQAGAAKKGVEPATARKVFDQVVAFSAFGFPKSHAAAFGLLAYQSAWLREEYPVEYYAGLFNNQPMGFYSLDALGRDARRHGVDIRLPDLNASRAGCVPEQNDIRIGLGMIRGWSTDLAAMVVEERERGGAFISLPDFLRRTPAAVKRDSIDNLIWVGGLDSLGIERRDLLWQAGLWLGPDPSDPGAGTVADQHSRRSQRADQGQSELGLPDPGADLRFAGTHDREKMVAEYNLLSFAASLHHPFALFGEQLPRGTVPSSRFSRMRTGSRVLSAGIVVARQRPQTAKGHVFILMEDEDGPVNAIIRPKIYEKCRAAIRLEPLIVVDGRLQRDGANISLIATEVRPLRLSASVPESARPSAPVRVDPNPVTGVDDSFQYLEALRRDPPPTTSWGRGNSR